MCNKLRDVCQSQTDGLLTRSEKGGGNSNTRKWATLCIPLAFTLPANKKLWGMPRTCTVKEPLRMHVLSTHIEHIKRKS